MFKATIVFVLSVVLFTSCAGEASRISSTANTNAVRTAAPESAKSSSANRATAANSNVGGGGQTMPSAQQVSLDQAENAQNQTAASERKIIRNADLALETDAPEAAQQRIASIAESKNGFVVESTQSSSDARSSGRDTVAMTVRVPAAKFTETLDEIRQSSGRVVSETVKGEDVTEEFIDAEARLRSQKALEAQFLEIMKQARTVEDALSVQRQLAEVRSEIEKVEGRRNFLQNQTAFSTIKLQIRTPAAFSANSAGFFARLTEALGAGFDAALNFVLAFVTVAIAVLPFLLLVVVPLFLFVRYLWRRTSRQKLASEIAKEEIGKV